MNPQTDKAFRVLPAAERHLQGIVACHARAFEEQFMVLLGPAFLEAFYRFYLSKPDAIVRVGVDDADRVLGFVAGGNPALRNEFTMRRVPFLAPGILGKAAFDRRVRSRLALHGRALLHALAARLGLAQASSSPAPVDRDGGPWSSLLSICTAPEAGGRGLGRALMEAFRDESRSRGFRTMRLCVHPGNDRAIRLYRGCGWEEYARSGESAWYRREV